MGYNVLDLFQGVATLFAVEPKVALARLGLMACGLLLVYLGVRGTLEPLLTVTQFEITPVVARIARPIVLKLSTYEVACVFGVPLPWLADPAHLHREQRMPPIPGREITVYRFDPYLGESVWGATARITLDLLALWRAFGRE
jgi:hypothetical protein